MRIGIVNQETWSFLKEVYADLDEYHTTSLFEYKMMHLPVFNHRINRMSMNRQLKTFLQSNDVVFFEWASQVLSTASHLPKTCGIVTRLHRYEMYGLVDHIHWDAVDKIILVSQAKKNEFLERFPDQAHKIEVIPVGVNPDLFSFNARPFSGNIGILCHLSPRKRVYELILAFYELSLREPGLRLHIGGGPQNGYGDYSLALQTLVSDLGLQKRVIFYGHVENPTQWYQTIDIFISNSYSEGLQVAPMEAMASGCYCLSHRWRGAEELLPDTNLYFTDSQLQQKILEYCAASETEKNKEKERMRAIVCEKFDVNDMKVRIRRVIESVGANHSTHHG